MHNLTSFVFVTTEFVTIHTGINGVDISLVLSCSCRSSLRRRRPSHSYSLVARARVERRYDTFFVSRSDSAVCIFFSEASAISFYRTLAVFVAKVGDSKCTKGFLVEEVSFCDGSPRHDLLFFFVSPPFSQKID